MALRCRRVGAVHSIIRVGFVMSAACPVYTQQQTLPDPVGTSLLCQQQTWAHSTRLVRFSPLRPDMILRGLVK